MRFRFEVATTGGLRVIPEIDDGQLVQIQGRNGIGKTVAVRLLELSTGTQPYATMPAAWRTLRNELQSAHITVTGLADGRRLTFDLEPADWPSEPVPCDEWLGTAELDGSPIAWKDVPPILRVYRIGGDESLTHSMAQQVQQAAERTQRVSAIAQGQMDTWEERLERLDDVIGAISVEALADRGRAVNEAVREVEEVRAHLDQARSRRRELEEIASLRESRTLLSRRLPQLAAELETVTGDKSRLRELITDLDARVAEFAQMSERSEELIEELDAKRRLHERRVRRRQQRETEAKAALADAGHPSLESKDSVEALIKELRSRLSEIGDKRREIDRAGLVIEVADEVEDPLVRARTQGLDNETIAEVHSRPITVRGLLGGVRAHRELLEDITEAGEGLALREEAAEIDRKLPLLSEAFRALRLLTTAEQDLQSVRTELREIADQLRIDARAEYEQLQQQREDATEELIGTLVRQGDIEREQKEIVERGPLAQVEARLAALDRPPRDDLGASIDEVDAAIEEAQSAFTAARRIQREAQRRLEEEREAVARTTRQLREEEDLAWVRQASVDLPDPSHSLDEQLAVAGRLRDGVTRLRGWLLRLRNNQEALLVALRSLGVSLRVTHPSTEGMTGGQLLAAVRRVYERRFAELLNDPLVLDALFDRGSDVHVDLAEMATAWTTPDGERRTRPLEAFSSGERAFAYTRVQLERIERDERPQQRVVFLDEFGAHMAHDRRGQLEVLLRERVLGRIADQVVIILPLRAKPSSEGDTAAVDERGYLMEILT